MTEILYGIRALLIFGACLVFYKLGFLAGTKHGAALVKAQTRRP